MPNTLNDGDWESIKHAISLQVSYWQEVHKRNESATMNRLAEQQIASWTKLLDKLDDM